MTKQIEKLAKSRWWTLVLVVVLGYLVAHLFKVTSLPVFADEAIYIRWAQLIMDDAQQYLFFALNDGKTPFFIWLLVPFQYLVSDQLLAGRIVSVLLGLGQVLTSGYLLYLLTRSRLVALWTMVLSSILPFWFMYHRMALMDGALTLAVSIASVITVQLAQKLSAHHVAHYAQQHNNQRFFQQIWSISLSSPRVMLSVLLLAMLVCLAVLIKLPAVLFFPVLLVMPALARIERSSYLQAAVLVGASVVLGMGMFSLLALHPAFPQLFARGGDFLYSFSELGSDGWQHVAKNMQEFVASAVLYLTPLVVLSPVMGAAFHYNRRRQVLLVVGILLYTLPIIVLGKVVYPRYYLPVALLFTVSAALLLDSALVKYNQLVQVQRKLIASLGIALFVANITAASVGWMVTAWTAVDQLPLTPVDRVQYLEEWSSGHGIVPVVALIQSEALRDPVAVATEGYFGTLPDAILMYLHRRPVENIAVEGIGQPVGQIPDWFWQKHGQSETYWLVVNSHRLKLQLPESALVVEYCRPNSAPCLQVWDISSLKPAT